MGGSKFFMTGLSAWHVGALCSQMTLAAGDCAPPVQALLKIVGAECTVINRELGAKSAERC